MDPVMICVQIPKPVGADAPTYNHRSLLIELVVDELLEILNAPSGAMKTERIQITTVEILIDKALAKLAKKLA